MKKSNFKKVLAGVVSATLVAGCVALAGCSQPAASSSAASNTASTSSASASSEAALQTDYMVLVNKQNKLPDWWNNVLQTVTVKNSEDADVTVEKKAYDAYLALKADLEKEGIYVDLDSAYRPPEDQQRIWNEFMDDYGEAYTKTHVAPPGCSEHESGLALDLYLIVDGKTVDENEELMQYPEIWKKIHSRLAEHGFILRYLDGASDVTGYDYEPWHIRYIDNPDVAKEIMDKGITFEAYLGVDAAAREANAKAKAEEAAAASGSVAAPAAAAGDYTVDYGTSTAYTKEDMDAAITAIMSEFANFKGAKMKSIEFTDDQSCIDDLEYANGTWNDNPDIEYVDAIVFTSTFDAPSGADAEGTAWEPGKEYKDWTWHLARTNGGEWKVLSNGYN